MPSVEDDIQSVYADDPDVVVLGLSSSIIGAEDPVDLAEFVQGMGLTFTILVDRGGTLYDEWRIDDPDAPAPYPREFVIDRNGVVTYAATHIDTAAIRAAVEAAR